MHSRFTTTQARDFANEVVAALRRHPDVAYADVRYVREDRQLVRVRNGRLEGASLRHTEGFGVRVLASGGWGFASTSTLGLGALQLAATGALDVARASAMASLTKVKWKEGPAHKGIYATAHELDALDVPLERKAADLLAFSEPLGAGKGPIRVGEGRGDFARRTTLLVSSEGTDVEQTFHYVGAGIVAYAVGDDGRAQRRSAPSGDENLVQGGYEQVARQRLAEEAPRVREEAIRLLDAPPCPTGKRDVILGSSQMALQIHESCGHPTELDRALGTEISLAGGSFLQPSMRGAFRYGSSIVNLVADATTPGGLGTFAFDDEGTPAQKTDLVRDGVFVGWLSSRETAADLGLTPSGAMRAESHERLPLVRMVNVSLEPGRGSFDELLADSDGAILFETNKSWSIDDLRLHFQFGCEAAWEIRGGKRVEMYRDPVYAGTTPSFWASCDAIAGAEAWRMWGIGNCGKGEPMQVMRVGHGASPARFRGVEVSRG